MKRLGLLLLAMGMLVSAGACGDSSVSGIGGGTTTTTTDTGSGCVGDATKWASITAGPFTCEKSSDCCVVMNGCLSQAQIVKATDYAAAPDAWPYCQDACVGCVGPAIEIACVDGTCVGESHDLSENPPPAADLFMNHCGVDATQIGTPSTKHKFGCGA